MSPHPPPPLRPPLAPGEPEWAARLRRGVDGEVRFGPFDRARYATDASIYQVEPLGVVLPRHTGDVARVLEVAAEAGAAVVLRGAGTSQAGQAIGRGVVVDTSTYLTAIGTPDLEDGTVWVEPGVVLDDLNRALQPHGFFFPVDVATASRATLGGMTANNSSGARSLRYGIMADNVVGVEALLADGSEVRFGRPRRGLVPRHGTGRGSAGPREGAPTAGAAPRQEELSRIVGELHRRERDEMDRRIPPVLRHVAGYNLHRIDPGGADLTRLLVGSEGTLAVLTAIGLRLHEIPRSATLGVCGFPSLTSALDAVQHIVSLGPSAVELLDGTLLGLAAEHPLYRETVRRIARPGSEALLIVEFAGPDAGEPRRGLDGLADLMNELGRPGALHRAESRAARDEVWRTRRGALDIVTSRSGPARPVSVVEDCAIPLDRLAEYGERVNRIFHDHGTAGTWYAHASVGCLHVRPSLDLATDGGLRALRSIAERVHDVVRELGGSHSGEHGDGIVRSEFIEPMLGSRLARAFREVKRAFDPEGLLNPGRIVDPPRMDDPGLLRVRAGGTPLPLVTALDWSAEGGLAVAAGRCNDNGACRSREPGVMCPSFRATRDEEHVTRGRANTLRLALAGRLGEAAMESAEMARAMELCVGCKACRRECPMGVDVARMKIEVLHRLHARRPRRTRERMVAALPRWAPLASRFRTLARLGAAVRGAVGFTTARRLPDWHHRPFRDAEAAADPAIADPATADVSLFVDTFTRWFEPDNARGALEVLAAAGYSVAIVRPVDGGGPLCCGRTWLNTGMVERARVAARRLLDAAAPHRGAVVGLEPSCLLTLRDELAVLFPPGSPESARAARLAERALLVTELLDRDRPPLALEPLRPAGDAGGGGAGPAARARVHGHCHEKAFGVDGATTSVLERIPGLVVSPIQSGCCGMAGSFGYEAEHYRISLAMAELDLLPAVRAEGPGTRLVASGTSCRAQIEHATGRTASHPVLLLRDALAAGGRDP